MAQVLSQEEIDALLRGVVEEEVETETGPSEEEQKEVQTFDIISQEGLIRSKRLAGLEMIHERFARTFRSSLSGMLSYSVDISNITMDMMKFGDFLKMLPVPSSLHILKFNPLSGNVLLVLETKLVFTLIDIIFGGKGDDSVKIEGREFTNIEHAMILKIVNLMIKDLNAAWQSVHPLNIEYRASEVNPQFVNIAFPVDTVIVTNFEIEFEYSTGVFTLCIPYAVIEPLKEELSSGYYEEEELGEASKEWFRRLRERLLEAEVTLEVELGKATLTTKDVLNLKVGDVIMLNTETDDLLTAKVEKVPKFKVKPGTVKSNIAISIEEAIPIGGI